MNGPDKNIDLKGMPVLLSASLPGEPADSSRASTFYTAVALLAHEIFSAGGRIIFGGHPSVVPLVREAANKLNKKEAIDVYQLRRFEGDAPEEIGDDAVFSRIHWIERDEDDIDAELAQLRDRMAEAARAAVFVGGKTADHYGKTPGIRDEYQRYMARHPEGPVYLVGLLGGETRRLIQEMEAGDPAARNGLSDEERQALHHSTSIDLIVSLIVGDLARKAEEDGKQA